MIKNEAVRIWVNRILALVVGGLVAVIAMSLIVTAPLRDRNNALAKQIDEIENGATRLLGEATVFMEIDSYTKALHTLDALFEKHPASAEAKEGAAMYTQIEATILENDQKWEAAVADVRAEWEKTTAAELRAKFERDRILMETSMADTLNTEWERSKGKIREEWEKM